MPKCFSVTLVNSNSERVFSFLILRVLSFSTGLGGSGGGAKSKGRKEAGRWREIKKKIRKSVTGKER